MVKLLAFSGSDRAGSKNTQVLDVAVAAAHEAGAAVERIRLSDLRLPIYGGDLESAEGLPTGCLEIKRLLKSCDGVLIASPEYNSGYTPLLKNAIDWASRPMAGEKPLECFDGKAAGLVSASPGPVGGIRGLFQLREVLSNIRMHVASTLGVVRNYGESMTADGQIVDERTRAWVESVGRETAALATKLRAGASA